MNDLFPPLTADQEKDKATRKMLFAYDCRNLGFDPRNATGDSRSPDQ